MNEITADRADNAHAGRWRRMLTVFLAVAGIGLMVFYEVCDTACSYLRGDLWGVDLKIVGILYMSAIVLFALLKRFDPVRILFAGGLGVEAYLIGFQIREDVLCPFCLAFAVLVLVGFMIHYRRPEMSESPWRRWLLHGMGDVALTPSGQKRVPLLIFAFLGYFFVSLTFSGSATPAYGAERAAFPSFGSGSVEVIVFSDYFCPPCQALEPQAEPILEELLASGQVKVTFVDTPFYKFSARYARYFLYALQEGGSFHDAVIVRGVLFDAARNHQAEKEEALGHILESRQISWRSADPKPVFDEWEKLLKNHKIKATPTFVIRYSDADVRTFVGGDKIMGGLRDLRAAVGVKR